ncbi:MAG: hypothetical protein WBC26_04925, partial [Alphaproteobacteria bacterium]
MTKILKRSQTDRHRMAAALWLLTFMVMLAVPVYANGAMGVKENVVVTGNNITVGDVFYGL